MKFRDAESNRMVVEMSASGENRNVALTGQADEGNRTGKMDIQVQTYCEVGKIARLFGNFDDAKRKLVTSIGFNGLLRMPYIAKLDDWFSLWFMRNLNPKTMILCLPNGESLKMTDLDAHFVLGIPFKGTQVIDETQHDKEVVSNVLAKLRICGEPTSLTMQYLESILVKDYGPKLSKSEKEAFTIAVVLYSMGCFLAVQKPERSFPMGLLRNFSGGSKIENMNWAAYVLTVLSNAAMKVQTRNSEEHDVIRIYGCTFLLQVMYLDNLSFAAASPVLLDLPRGSAYNEAYMNYLIKMDISEEKDGVIIQYGRHKLRDVAEVCYTRGWKEDRSNENKIWSKDYISTSAIFHQIIQYDDKLARSIAPSLCKLSADTASDIKKTYKSWYPNYTTTLLALSKGTLPTSEKCTTTKRKEIECEDSENSDESALHMLANEATRDDADHLKRKKKNLSKQESNMNSTVSNTPSTVGEFVTENGVLKKVVTEHSNFSKSPFDLFCFMFGVPYKNKCTLFGWIQSELKGWGELTIVWVHLKYPAPISLLGYSLKSQLSINGAFSPAMVDAITRTSINFDDKPYGVSGTRWRHYLPSRFAESVLRGEKYLDSEEIKAHFTGHHIKYPVQNCRMIIAPVYYQGRWSCYFWDFKQRRITVLDPTRMNLLPSDVELQHGDLVDTLTNALFSCIDHFFTGWEFNKTRWQQVYPTNHGPSTEICNSGLYSVLYSRFFDGVKLVCTPGYGVLIEPRSALLYQLLTMRDNVGHIPTKIKQMLYQIR